MFVDNCWNLRSLELMCVVNFRANKYQNPSEFVECLKNLVTDKSRARTQLKSLSLPNNFLGDDLVSFICTDVLSKLEALEEINLSTNKITDIGVQCFFQFVVKNNPRLRTLIINTAKIRAVETCQVMAECVSSCHNLTAISIKRCGIDLDLFKQLLNPSKTEKTGSGNEGKITFIPARLTKLELGSNQIGNPGLKYFKDFLIFSLLNRSNLREISLYDIGITGEQSVVDLRDMVNDSFPHLQLLNVEGNMFDGIETMVLHSFLAKINDACKRSVKLTLKPLFHQI